MSMRDKIAKAVMGIKAYHSSPHDFDRFDLSKIGTGEGAQVYGHGIYAAENPAVSGQGGQYWQQFLNKFSGPEMRTAEFLKQHGFDRDAAIAELKRQYADPATHSSRSAIQTKLDLLGDNVPIGPRTYELNIKADPSQFLDWDKPIQGQPVFDAVAGSRNKLLRDVLGRTDTGQNLYKALSYDTGLWKKGSEASKMLADEGVPGIKYLDQGSRMPGPSGLTTQQLQTRLDTMRQDLAGGKGSQSFLERQIGSIENELERFHQNPSSNYVVFDPSIIDIAKKYALPGALGAGAMGGIAAQDQYEVAQ